MANKSTMNDEENQKSTSFEDFDDLMSRTAEIESIIKVIEGEHADEDDDSYVFAINGEYGSGKTKFLELFKEKIEGKGKNKKEKDIKNKDENKEEKNKPGRVLEIDAWRDSFANDPFLSICHGFFDFFEAENKNKLKIIINKISLPTLAVANQILSIIPGLKELTPIQIAKHQNELEAMQEKVGTNLSVFSDLKEKKDAFSDVKELLKEYVKLKNETSGNEKPTYILVDELDRCSPEYAVKFLETIHHFFCVEGLVFIIAIDPSQLRSYVKKIYGVDDDRFDSWYAKFIKASYNLQSIWDKMAKNPGDNLKSEYIEEKFSELFDNLKNCKKNDFRDPETTIGKISKSFDLTLRQVNFLIKSIKRWYFHNNSDRYRRNDAELEVATFLIALKLKNSSDYNQVANILEIANDEAMKNIKDFLSKKYSDLPDIFMASCIIVKEGIPTERVIRQELKDILEQELYITYHNQLADNGDKLLFLRKDRDLCKERDRYSVTSKSVSLTIYEEIEEMKDFG